MNFKIRFNFDFYCFPKIRDNIVIIRIKELEFDVKEDFTHL